MVSSTNIDGSTGHGKSLSFEAASPHKFDPRDGQEAKQRMARLRSSLELLEDQQPQICDA
jgi:hypothetical protein